MPLGKWTKKNQTLEIKNPWWIYRRDAVILPSGKEGEYHFVHTNGSSMVVPLLDDGSIMMVRQYRYLVGRESLEFVCGSVKDNSSHYDTAVAELAEEAGYASDEMTFVGEFNPYNGITDEICRVYAARKLRQVNSLPDETEEFEKIVMKPAQIDEGIRSGEIWDGMSLAAWLLVKEKLLC